MHENLLLFLLPWLHWLCSFWSKSTVIEHAPSRVSRCISQARSFQHRRASDRCGRLLPGSRRICRVVCAASTGSGAKFFQDTEYSVHTVKRALFVPVQRVGMCLFETLELIPVFFLLPHGKPVYVRAQRRAVQVRFLSTDLSNVSLFSLRYTSEGNVIVRVICSLFAFSSVITIKSSLRCRRIRGC